MSNSKADLLSSTFPKKKQRNYTKLFIIYGLIFIAVIVFGAVYLFFQLSNANLFNRQTVVFEPSCYATQDCDDDLLEETADRLSNRAYADGYKSTTFHVNNDGFLVGKVPEGTDIRQFADEITTPVLLEFVDFGETFITPKTIVQTDYENSDNDENEPVYHSIMTGEVILVMNVIQMDDQIVLAFELDQEGTDILADFSANHIGSFLGIVLNKEVISSPKINSAITGGSGSISGDFTYEEANELARSFKLKNLPYGISLVE